MSGYDGVLLLDTETTDIENPEVIQLAYIDYGSATAKRPRRGEAPVSYLFKPEGMIAPSAMAVHRIIPAHLEDMPPSSSVRLPYGGGYMIGHNVDFDWSALGSPSSWRRICTLAMARRVWPEFQKHNQSALIFELMEPEEALDATEHAHDALVDIGLCDHILACLEKDICDRGLHEEVNLPSPDGWTWEAWHKFSEWCRVPTHMAVGKHKGEPIGDVPTSYLQWMLRNDFDEYTLTAVRRELARRK